MVALARAFLDDPHWGWHAAQALGAEVARPPQYQRAAAQGLAGRGDPGLSAPRSPVLGPPPSRQRGRFVQNGRSEG